FTPTATPDLYTLSLHDALPIFGIGGTAVGTGLTAHPRFRSRVVRELSRLVGQRLTPATSTVTTTWSLRPLLACSAALPDQTRERSEEHTSELQSRSELVCRLLL